MRAPSRSRAARFAGAAIGLAGWMVAALSGCGSEEPARLAPAQHAGHAEHAQHAEHTEHAGHAEHAEPPSGEAEPSGATAYGAPLDRGLPVTALAAIVEEPERFRDQTVRTEGQIARVCQRMGCWMELREGEDSPAVRVPMAGHAFFLPRDAAGRRAEIVGRVTLRELSPETREHLESEGAVATASALSIDATGVAIAAD